MSDKLYLKYKNEADERGFLRISVDENFDRIVFFTWINKFVDVDLCINCNNHMEEGEQIKYTYRWKKTTTQ